MTQKVLPYAIVEAPQETGYWCGPASTEMVLSCRGIDETEANLARQLGTHTGGTDWIGQFPPVINRYLPEAEYTHKDNPSQDELWDAVVKAVDGGYGVVGNVVVPPHNRPRGVLGAPTLNYPSGYTVYHYISLLGYSDEYEGGAIYWADSGFSQFWSWVSLEQTAQLIYPKGIAYPTNVGPDTWAKIAADIAGVRV